VLGVAKAYVTRVGEGPFPSEILDARQEQLRDAGGEYGTVTGRTRRCGWLDFVALRYAVRLNGMTTLAITKLDVLSIFDEIPVCVAYDLPDGTRTTEFPAHQTDFHHATPVFETLPGWGVALDHVESLEDLPAEARQYIGFIEQQLGIHVSLIGTGQSRERILSSGPLEALA
jgi:adenylosuccinate synthase